MTTLTAAVKRLAEPFRALTIATKSGQEASGLANEFYLKEVAAVASINRRGLNEKLFWRLLNEQDNRIWEEVS